MLFSVIIVCSARAVRDGLMGNGCPECNQAPRIDLFLSAIEKIGHCAFKEQVYFDVIVPVRHRHRICRVTFDHKFVFGIDPFLAFAVHSHAQIPELIAQYQEETLIWKEHDSITI